MAYADFTNKTILEKYGVGKIVLAEACSAGDLLTGDGYLADAEDSKAAVWVACEDGAASGIIEVAQAAIIFKESSGTTRGDHGGTAGTALYLDGTDDEGELTATTTGTIPQVCGKVLEQDTVFVCPNLYLSGVAASVTTLAASGAVTMASTLKVTGAMEVTSTLAVTGAVTMASTLKVTGNTEVTGTLTVTGATKITGALEVTGALTVTGATTLKGNTDVGDATADTLGFFGKTKSARVAFVSDVTDATTTGNITAINGIKNALVTFGLMSSA